MLTHSEQLQRVVSPSPRMAHQMRAWQGTTQPHPTQVPQPVQPACRPSMMSRRGANGRSQLTVGQVRGALATRRTAQRVPHRKVQPSLRPCLTPRGAAHLCLRSSVRRPPPAQHPYSVLESPTRGRLHPQPMSLTKRRLWASASAQVKCTQLSPCSALA